MRNYVKTNLLTTSSRTDALISAGVLALTGLSKIRLADVISIEHHRSKPEVQQVYTIGTTVPVIQAGLTYTIQIITPTRIQGSPSKVAFYKTTAPSILSGSAATDRSLIYNALANQINADPLNFVSAVADVGGTGVSMTITDDPGYNAARPSTRGGVNGVNLTSGFVQAIHLVKTTAGVISYGQGARMAQDVPVFGPMTGNLDAGELDGVAGAVAGQNYDGFIITYNLGVNHNAIGGLKGQVQDKEILYVDNGTGASTTNLAGFIDFLKEMNRAIYGIFKNDPSTLVDTFENMPRFYKNDGYSAPVGTAGTTNYMATEDKNVFAYYNTALATSVLAPTWSASGLQLDLDETDTHGIEISANPLAIHKGSFIVGKTAFSFRVRMAVGTVANGIIAMGVRAKAAFQAAITSYTDFAAIETVVANTASLLVAGNKSSGGVYTVASGATLSNGVEVDLEIQVDMYGNVTAWINGVQFTVYSAANVPLVLTAGQEFIPFVQAANHGGSAPNTLLKEFESIPAIIAY